MGDGFCLGEALWNLVERVLVRHDFNVGPTCLLGLQLQDSEITLERMCGSLDGGLIPGSKGILKLRDEFGDFFNECVDHGVEDVLVMIHRSEGRLKIDFVHSWFCADCLRQEILGPLEKFVH